MITHIFTYRDTSYPTEERQKAIFLDHIMCAYVIPYALLTKLPGLNSDKILDFERTYPRAGFGANAVVWTGVLYGGGFLLFAFYRRMKDRTKQSTQRLSARSIEKRSS